MDERSDVDERSGLDESADDERSDVDERSEAEQDHSENEERDSDNEFVYKTAGVEKKRRLERQASCVPIKRHKAARIQSDSEEEESAQSTWKHLLSEPDPSSRPSPETSNSTSAKPQDPLQCTLETSRKEKTHKSHSEDNQPHSDLKQKSLAKVLCVKNHLHHKKLKASV